MKKTLYTASIMTLALFLGNEKASAISKETAMLLDLLQTKGVINQSDAISFKKTIETEMANTPVPVDSHRHSVQSLASRLEKLEKTPISESSSLSDKIYLSGFVEVAAASSRTDNGTGTITNENDINLATAELDLDATINQYTNAHLAFLYEEDAGNNISLDEGIISLDGGDRLPMYLNVGKMYLPFGQFKSHFITDPLTLTLGETNDTALVMGYTNSLLAINAGAFNGTIQKTGESSQVNSYVGSAIITLPEKSISNLVANIGISYLSNLATSDELQTTINTGNGNLTDMVGAYSAFGHFEYLDRFFLDLEYLSALDNFTINDLSFIDANNQKPSAWNIELAAIIIPKLELALRYGGTDETGSAYADKMYGAALLYDILDNTAFTFEYISQDFTDNSDGQSATVQMAVEF